MVDKPLLVGELNPYSGHDRLALYHEPPQSAGGRLCRKVLGLDPPVYRASFDRVNLCAGRWSAKVARSHALELACMRDGPIVLLGTKVAAAFGLPFEPFAVDGRFCVLPHPSGLCRYWNEPGAFLRARRAVTACCPSLVGVLPG